MDLHNLNDVELVSESTEKLIKKSMSLAEFIEFLGPRITNKDADVRERAIEVIVSVLCKLPGNFLDSKEVELLINFLLSRFDESLLADGTVVLGIKHLVLSFANLPVGCEKSIIQRLFIDGNLQEWGQKDRFALFEVLEYFIRERVDGVRAMGVEFLLGFIRSMTGERDPRCLMIAFRLFYKVVQLIPPFGPFVEDLFDVVACYYPIEFKPSVNDQTGITRDLLVSECEKCLMSHHLFAPFTYQMIAEKLVDDELEEDVKLEVCSFLARVCENFPMGALREQLDDLLAGIRMIALNPATKSATMPSEIIAAIKEIMQKLSSSSDVNSESTDLIDHICNEFLENIEPFVVQSEMGLSARSLALLEMLVSCHPSTSKQIIENVFNWLVMIIKGETVNSAANRDEVIEEGLSYLPRWCKLAISTSNESVISFRRDAILEALKAVHLPTANYSLAEVFVSQSESDNTMINLFDDLLKSAVEDVNNTDSNIRIAARSFVREFSLHNWDVLIKLLPKHIDPMKDNPTIIPILCAAIHNEVTKDFMLVYLEPLLSQPKAWSPSNLDCLLALFSANESKESVGSFREQLFYRLFDILTSTPDDEVLAAHSSTLAELLQDIGLTFHERIHSSVMQFFIERVRKRTVIFAIVYLFATQSKNAAEISGMLQQVCDKRGMEWERIVLLGAMVNKIGYDPYVSNNFATFCSQLSKESEIRCRGVVCRHELLNGRPEGWSSLEKLLDDIEKCPQDEAILSKTLCDVIDLDSRHSNLSKCRYQSTVLAPQRIFHQILPVLVRHFNALPNDAVNARSAYFKMLSPLLRLADKISIPITSEYLKLLPIFCEAIDAKGLSVDTEETVLNGLVELLKSASREQLRADFIAKVMPKIRHFITEGRSVRLIELALKCLEMMARQCDASLLLPHFKEIIPSVISASGSKKRRIRADAANVRNLWELLPTR